MPKHFKLLVPGATAANTINVTAPFDGAHIATIETSDKNAVETALGTAYDLFRNKKNWLTAEQRINVLEKAADIMQQRFDELATEAAREGGKPLMDSKVEVARAGTFLVLEHHLPISTADGSKIEVLIVEVGTLELILFTEPDLGNV